MSHSSPVLNLKIKILEIWTCTTLTIKCVWLPTQPILPPTTLERSEWEEMVKHKVPLKCPESTMCLSKTPLLLFDVLIDYNFLQNATRIKSK